MLDSQSKQILKVGDIDIWRISFVNPTEVASLIRDSGLIRPVDDLDRIKRMYENSNLLIAAYDGQQMVGISRSLTDFSYSTYLADLAVKRSYQNQGIGRALIDAVRKEIGPESMCLLIAGPLARRYYPHIGFDHVEHAWILNREK